MDSSSVPEGADLVQQRWHRWAMVLILAGVSLFSSFFGERIPVRDGVGWDGEFYYKVAANPVEGYEIIRNDPYRFQRVLPSLIVNAGLRVCGLATDKPHVIAGFLAFNSAVLLLALLLWHKLSDVLKLSTVAEWLGFLGLFCSFAAMKMAFYYPTLTDTAALALGMVFTYCYLTRRSGLLAVAAILGSFTWQISGMLGAVLVLFPCQTEPEVQTPAGQNDGIAKVVAGIATATVVVVVWDLYSRGIRQAGWGPVVPMVEEAFYLSLFCSALTAWMLVFTLLKGLTFASILSSLRSLSAWNVVLAAAVILIPKMIVSSFSQGEPFIAMSKGLQASFFLSTTRPAIFLVAHLAYFGPIFLLLPFIWKQVGERIRAWGPGAILFFLAATLVLPGPESRSNCLPVALLVTAIVISLDRANLARPSLLLIMAPVSLLLSRVWLPLNVLRAVPVEDPGLEGPWDLSRYYETQGQFMTMPTYLTALAIILATLAVLRYLFEASRPGQGGKPPRRVKPEKGQ